MIKRQISLDEMNHRVIEFAKQSGWWFLCSFKNTALKTHNYYKSPDRTNALLLVGDSRISGGQWDKLDLTIKVITSGFGGSNFAGNTLEWSSRLAIQSIISQNPKAIMIALGVNDLGAGVSLKKIFGALHKIYFALVNNTDSKIYIHCGLPILKHFRAENRDVIEMNRLFKIFCSINSVPFIDLFIQFMDPANGFALIDYLNMNELQLALYKDTCPVHYSEKGYEAWYGLLRNYFLEEIGGW